MPDPVATVRVERWSDIWPDAEPLAVAHTAEVYGPATELRLDAGLMAAMDAAGVLLIVAARVDGALVGYLFWTVAPDPERGGDTVAHQGSWFIAPGLPPEVERLRLGMRMMDLSLARFRACGVRGAKLHHPTRGRGARLGAYFRRLGGVVETTTYEVRF